MKNDKNQDEKEVIKIKIKKLNYKKKIYFFLFFQKTLDYYYYQNGKEQ